MLKLPLTVSCSSKSRLVLPFQVPAHPGSTGQGAVIWVSVCPWHFPNLYLEFYDLSSVQPSNTIMRMLNKIYLDWPVSALRSVLGRLLRSQTEHSGISVPAWSPEILFCRRYQLWHLKPRQQQLIITPIMITDNWIHSSVTWYQQ